MQIPDEPVNLSTPGRTTLQHLPISPLPGSDVRAHNAAYVVSRAAIGEKGRSRALGQGGKGRRAQAGGVLKPAATNRSAVRREVSWEYLML